LRSRRVATGERAPCSGDGAIAARHNADGVPGCAGGATTRRIRRARNEAQVQPPVPRAAGEGRIRVYDEAASW
jgi:hypothetical protein